MPLYGPPTRLLGSVKAEDECPWAVQLTLMTWRRAQAAAQRGMLPKSSRWMPPHDADRRRSTRGMMPQPPREVESKFRFRLMQIRNLPMLWVGSALSVRPGTFRVVRVG
jgi:hypothetical protein